MSEHQPTHTGPAALAGAPAPRTPSPDGAHEPGMNDRTPAPQPTSPAAAPRRGIVTTLRRLLLVVLGVVALGGGTVVAYRWWQDSLTYVSTDNAQVSGYMTQIGTLEAGQVTSVTYDLGDRISRDEVVAQVNVPTPVDTTAAGTPRLQFTGTTDTLANVRSPVDGVVVARGANPGDVVPAGQPILTVVDPNQLWVIANVGETDVHRVRSGQPVSVHVDNLNADLFGRVVAIVQASAQSFSPLPQQNLSGNYTKVTQLQPVKIELDHPDPRLALGTSVEVKVRVVD